jgi:hypothetical protein
MQDKEGPDGSFGAAVDASQSELPAAEAKAAVSGAAEEQAAAESLEMQQQLHVKAEERLSPGSGGSAVLDARDALLGCGGVVDSRQIWECTVVQRNECTGNGERFQFAGFDHRDDAGGVGKSDSRRRRVAGCDL